MSGQAEQSGRLKAKDLHRLLDLLHNYIKSAQVEIKAQSRLPDTSGNPVHIDAVSFLRGFADYAQAESEDREKILGDLKLVMELSTYVRNGGSKALLYRLETGCFNITPDYFDNLAASLSNNWVDGKFILRPEQNSSTLFKRLKEINAEDESRVSAVISELDEILLELHRKLEEASWKELAQQAGEEGRDRKE